jgi:hypothetical protein
VIQSCNWDSNELLSLVKPFVLPSRTCPALEKARSLDTIIQNDPSTMPCELVILKQTTSISFFSFVSSYNDIRYDISAYNLA